MDNSRKYYFLKLRETFFNSDRILEIQGMENGYALTDILLKFYLMSLKNGGMLAFENGRPYSNDVLASIVRHPKEDIDQAIKIFDEVGLIETLEDGTIFMGEEIQAMIGKSSDEADRKRAYRRKIDVAKKTAASQPVNEAPKEQAKQPSSDIEKPLPTAIPEYTDDFERAWEIYPRKDGKKAAYKAYMARIKSGISPEELIEATKGYADECAREHRDKKYTKLGSTFYGPDSWFKDFLKPKDGPKYNDDDPFKDWRQ